MSAKSYSRGNEIYYDSDGLWKYSDDDSVFDDSKPCKRCGKYPNKDGSDACTGWVEGMKSVCCGHGITEPIMIEKEEF